MRALPLIAALGFSSIAHACWSRWDHVHVYYSPEIAAWVTLSITETLGEKRACAVSVTLPGTSTSYTTRNRIGRGRADWQGHDQSAKAELRAQLLECARSQLLDGVRLIEQRPLTRREMRTRGLHVAIRSLGKTTRHGHGVEVTATSYAVSVTENGREVFVSEPGWADKPPAVDLFTRDESPSLMVVRVEYARPPVGAGPYVVVERGFSPRIANTVTVDSLAEAVGRAAPEVGRSLATIQIQRGLLQRRNRQLWHAERCFLNAVALDRQDIEARLNLAAVRSVRGKMRPALQVLQECFQLDRETALARVQRDPSFAALRQRPELRALTEGAAGP